MQTSYGYPAKRTFAGDVISEDYSTDIKPALEKITAGSVVGFVGTENLGYQNPSANKFVFSADLITSNKINLNLTIKTLDSNNAESSVTVAMAEVTYATSHAATMTAICTAISTADTTGKTTATVDSSDSNGRTIYVTHSDNAVISVAGVAVTAGSSQATVSYNFYGTLMGIAIYTGRHEQDIATGKAYIQPTEPVTCLKRGIAAILSVDAMTMASSLYVMFIDDTSTPVYRGQIRTSAASSKAIAFTDLKPNAKVAAGEISEIELNRP